MTRVFAHPVNTNISANIGPILGRQHNCRHCWPADNRYRAIIGPMLTEFNIICADNSTADADEISETDIGPISAHCRHVCCCPNIGIQYWPDIGSFSEVLILAEYWHTISARYWLIVYANDHLCNRLNSGIQYWPDIGSFSKVMILAEYWHTISARYWFIVYTVVHSKFKKFVLHLVI